MPMKKEEALTILNALRSQPEVFLKANKVKIMGGDRGGPSDNQEWSVEYKPGTQVIVFNADSPDPRKFSAHAVAMHNFGGEDKGAAHAAALGPLAIDRLPSYELSSAGADLMMTSQLTGCSFVMLQKGDKVYCTHIEPGGELNEGGKLEKALQKDGRFERFPGDKLSVFGAKKYAGFVAYIVGARINKKWSIWAQVRPVGPGSDDQPIKAVHKLL